MHSLSEKAVQFGIFTQQINTQSLNGNGQVVVTNFSNKGQQNSQKWTILISLKSPPKILFVNQIDLFSKQ